MVHNKVYIYVRLFDIPSKSSSRDCIDKDPHCPAWGLHSECERNPQYMVGSEDDLGYCRKSCKSLHRAWGLHGECERNPQYMVGSEDDLGYCRKSCKVCSS
ncbi:Procollagen-proline 4-dioxygenase [Abeliophyllum distichum]|uniref:Procollagen-proline 4-dioxygenase n=1 Tax=Abeliophyllum distichum TaxID=126358 RepID=A0ABD1RG59_9LAMI